MWLYFGCFLYRTTSKRIEPCFGCFLPLYLCRCPMPAEVCVIRYRCPSTLFNQRVDRLLDTKEQTHLCYRGDIGTLPVCPHINDHTCSR